MDKKKFIDAENLNKRLQRERLLGRSETYITDACNPIVATYERVMQIVNSMPTADVQEVRHGKWEQENDIFTCSECGYQFECEGYTQFFNYCPNCGAKMDGEKR